MMNVDNLVLEITRRCNLKCAHCMRGCAQRLDMTGGIIFKSLYGIKSINCLTVTGGEPSMKPEIIGKIMDTIRMLSINVSYFYIVTNAHSTYKRKEFLNELDRLYAWCDEKNMCSLVVSQDNYHLWVHQPNMTYYNCDPYDYIDDYTAPREYIHLDARKGYIQEPINEGRAEETGVGYREKKPQNLWMCSIYNDELYVQENEVYVSANGNVTSCCDMSYARIDAEHKGNVLEQSLQTIIESYCEMEEQEEAA